MLTIMLAGCQGIAVLDRHDERSPAIMPLWEQYQRCLASTDPETLLPLVDRFDRVILTGAEPPAWMKAFSRQAHPQPLRTSVDPSALGAACTIKAATVLTAQDRYSEARALYQRILIRYDRQHWAFYREQAQEALAALPPQDPTLVALRPRAAPLLAQ